MDKTIVSTTPRNSNLSISLSVKDNSALDQWVSRNQLDRDYAKRFLNQLDNNALGLVTQCPGFEEDPIEFDAYTAWKVSYYAFVEACPALAGEAERIYTETPKLLKPKNGHPIRAFTYDRGSGALPLVYAQYQEDAQSLLTVAHEFGHAVQIIASSKGSTEVCRMPPIAREVCAFISELYLIQYVQQYYSPLFTSLVAAWIRDNYHYMISDAGQLRKDLSSDCSEYNYRWNYPMARAFSYIMWKKKPRKMIEEIFFSGELAPALMPYEDVFSCPVIPHYSKTDEGGSSQCLT